jgi:HlyD family secretion protein
MTILLRRFTIWLALAGLTSLVLFVKANTSVPPMPEPLAPPPVNPYSKSIGASGLVEARQENTSIGASYAGLVKEVKVKVWQKIKAGEPLFLLDDSELATQLANARGDLALRQAELARAQRQYDRLAKITGLAVAKEDVDKREDDLQVAKAAVVKAQTSIESAQLLLGRSVVRAPIDATVLQVNIRAGEHTTPGGVTAPIILGAIEELQVRADVDEQLAPRVRDGARAVAFRKGETANPIPLEFVRIEPYIVPKKSLTGSGAERVDTRVLPVVFRFPNPPGLRAYVGQQMDIFIEEMPSE